MLMHVTAHEGFTDTGRECALKADSGRKILCRTGESNLRQQRAGPTLYQLSYIPTASSLSCLAQQMWVFSLCLICFCFLFGRFFLTFSFALTVPRVKNRPKSTVLLLRSGFTSVFLN